MSVTGDNQNRIESEDIKNDKERKQKTAVGVSVAHSAQISTVKANAKFAKPDKYAGNRNLYDKGSAKKNAKLNAFENGKQPRDQYTGKKLVLTIKEAKLKYGDKWQEHLAEADHIRPLKVIFKENKDNPFITNEDLKNIANSKSNMQVVSRTYNNGKRDKTNEQFVSDEEYLKRKKLKITDEKKREAIETSKKAKKEINKEVRITTVKNIAGTAHEAGKDASVRGAETAAVVSIVNNVMEVFQGEKEVGEAVTDVAVDTGKAAATSYVTGAGLTVVSHMVSSAPSKFLQKIASSSIPGMVVTFVMSNSSSIKNYVEGEISTHDLVMEVGKTGTEMLLFNVIGFAVGAPLGPVVGTLTSMLASVACETLISYKQKIEESGKLYQKKISRLAAIETAALKEIQYQRKWLEEKINSEFQGWDKNFEEGFQYMLDSVMKNDFSEFSSGLDKIMSVFGTEAMFHSEREVENFLFDEEAVLQF